MNAGLCLAESRIFEIHSFQNLSLSRRRHNLYTLLSIGGCRWSQTTRGICQLGYSQSRYPYGIYTLYLRRKRGMIPHISFPTSWFSKPISTPALRSSICTEGENRTHKNMGLNHTRIPASATSAIVHPTGSAPVLLAKLPFKDSVSTNSTMGA